MLNLSAIYTRSDFDASGAASESAATAVLACGGHAKCFHFRKCFQIVSISTMRLSRVDTTVSENVSNVSIFSEEFQKKN
jgi:hypothetical protein